MLVQENYLNAMQAGMDKRSGGREARADLRDLERMAEAADLISTGDTANILIRRDQNWSLLPDFGMLSSVAPSIVAQGGQAYPAFPQLLGKYSSLRKVRRLQRELK